MANILASLLGLDKKPVGTGMADQARQALVNRGYQLHVQEAKASGETPMTLEQWAAQQRN